MPSGRLVATCAPRPARRGGLPVALFCACVVLGQSGLAPQPATGPASETIGAARKRLARTNPADRTRHEQALLAALELVLAIGDGHGQRAAATIDVVGYQRLPLDGDLPERPDKPIPPAVIEKEVAARLKVDVAGLPVECVTVLDRATLRSEFPAVAAWMLPQQDLAVLIRPPPGEPLAYWLLRNACLVVRLRGERATIVGGNLLEALGLGTQPAAPGPQRK